MLFKPIVEQANAPMLDREEDDLSIAVCHPQN